MVLLVSVAILLIRWRGEQQYTVDDDDDDANCIIEGRAPGSGSVKYAFKLEQHTTDRLIVSGRGIDGQMFKLELHLDEQTTKQKVFYKHESGAEVPGTAQWCDNEMTCIRDFPVYALMSSDCNKIRCNSPENLEFWMNIYFIPHD